MVDIAKILDKTLIEIEYDNLETIPVSVIKEVINIFKRIDNELNPLLDLLIFSIEQQSDESINTIILYRLLKFYGLWGDPKVLQTRQKFLLKDKNLVKKPFLKQKDKKHINILLKDYGLYVWGNHNAKI